MELSKTNAAWDPRGNRPWWMCRWKHLRNTSKNTMRNLVMSGSLTAPLMLRRIPSRGGIEGDNVELDSF